VATAIMVVVLGTYPKKGCEQAQQMVTYSITSSARASGVGGTSMPSALDNAAR
jgi:hypothetical protein